MRKTRLEISVIIFMIFIFSFSAFSSFLTVNAETFSYCIPSFGLYCADGKVILNGYEKYDITDMDMLSENKCIKTSEYLVQTEMSCVELSIPFISRACEIPEIELTVDGEKKCGKICYGERVLIDNCNELDFENLVAKKNSSSLDESIFGTLYTVIPGSDMINITMQFSQCLGYIYDVSNSFTINKISDREQSFEISNVNLNSKYEFFIIGDNSLCTFSSNCRYESLEMSLKSYIDLNYEDLKEFYIDNDVSKDFLYSLGNSIVNNKTQIEYTDMFINQVSYYRLNTYNFFIENNKVSTVKYNMEVSIECNKRFLPEIYLVMHKQIGEYTTKYSIALNSTVKNIIEASSIIDGDYTNYEAYTRDGLYFVIGSDLNPIDKEGDMNKFNYEIFIICVLIAIFISLTLVVATLIYVKRNKR